MTAPILTARHFICFKIASEYDGWDLSRRAAYIVGLLRENINESQGTDLRKLRSAKLEALLLQESTKPPT